MQTGKIDALYARFSHDENYGSDSDSVAHQKELLADYANSHGFTNQKFYVDMYPPKMIQFNLSPPGGEGVEKISPP